MRESIADDGHYITHDELRKSALTQDELLLSIEGAQAVVDYFGSWESCHDAEILEIQIRHTDTCLVSLHAFGSSAPAWNKWNHAILSFSLRGIRNLSLEGYFRQNALAEVTFQRVNDGLRMVLWGVHGTEGWIEANAIAVDVYRMTIPGSSGQGT